MSKINDRSLQLKLIYNDEDLRKPDQDQIMKMLDAWLRVPENLLSMVRPTFDVRQISIRHQLPPTPFENEVIRKLGWNCFLPVWKKNKFKQKHTSRFVSFHSKSKRADAVSVTD